MLALFVGFQLISKVPSILHTPLMSGTNAIHGIILVGAIVLAGTRHGPLGVIIGAAAVVLGTINVVGGFVVTDRMLEHVQAAPAAARAATGRRRAMSNARPRRPTCSRRSCSSSALCACARRPRPARATPIAAAGMLLAIVADA